MNIIKKAIKAAKEFDAAFSYRPIGGYQPTVSVASQPPNTGFNVQLPPSVKLVCPYKTPCGWCSKWDKKCDNQVQESESNNTEPCRDCSCYQWDMPQCKECNAENNFKYFREW